MRILFVLGEIDIMLESSILSFVNIVLFQNLKIRTNVKRNDRIKDCID